MDNSVLANNIKVLRNHRNVTQQELARIAGVTNKAVSSWENGNSVPRGKVLASISEYFQIPVDFFYKPNGIIIFELDNSYVDPIDSNLGKRLESMANELSNLDSQTRYSHILAPMLENKDERYSKKTISKMETYQIIQKMINQAKQLNTLFEYYYSLPEPMKPGFFSAIEGTLQYFDGFSLMAYERFNKVHTEEK